MTDDLQMPEGYARLIEDMRRVPPPELDFERMEVILKQAASARESTASPVAPLIALAAGVLLAAGVFMQEPAPAPSARQPAVRPGAVPTEPIAPPILTSAIVTAITGKVTAELLNHIYGYAPVVPSRQLALDARVIHGHRIFTEDGRADFRLVHETGWSLAPHTEVTLGPLGADPVHAELRLARGRVASKVGPLGPTGVYRVDAGDYRVEVLGTHFEVAFDGEHLEVRVDEGRVSIHRSGTLLNTLEAPAHWNSNPSAVPPPDEPVALPIALDGLNWSALRLPAFEGVSNWSVLGQGFPGGAVLATRVPAGDVPLIARMADGRELAVTAHVDPTGTRFDPAQLELRQAADAPTRGVLSPDAITSVVRKGMPALQRCYERSMKRQPALKARFSLRVHVDRRGAVRGVKLPAGKLPVQLGRCLESAARGWQFEAPRGGPVSFDLPLDFRQRR